MNQIGYVPLLLAGIANQIAIPLPFDLVILGMLALGFNKFSVVGVAIIGLTIGAIFDYVLGRYGLVIIPWFKKERKTKTYKRAEKIYRKYGQWTLLVTFLPIIGKYFPLIAGIMETPWLNFLVIYVTGKIVYYGLWLIILSKVL